MRIHERLRFAAAIALASTALIAATPAARQSGAVKVASKLGVGRFLTDARGMTLYVFRKDAPGKSACEGPCVAKWPVFFREKVEPSGGPSPSDFGTITRGDGKPQTTYKGLPLYYFADDQAPSDTKGQGFKDVWVVASP